MLTVEGRPESPMAKASTVLVKRHSLLVRITHWLNVLSLWLLLMSGLQIFNAHPALYWGQASDFARPWLSIGAVNTPAGPRGVTNVSGVRFDTTGVLGVSRAANGQPVGRAFPSAVTLPGERVLAIGRRWHFFAAWVFAINGVIYLATALLGGHLRRDLAPTGAELRPRRLWDEIRSHARLRFPKGEEARRYNTLQKVAYLAVILVLLPVVALTGMTMSPSLNASIPFLVDLFGGRQSARSIHFICANLIVLFVLVHVAMVVVSGLWNNLRSMITGRYAIEVEPAQPERIEA
jgi:thiosulfate reductase cytochrome b subunit